MARGWESKSIEAQQADAAAASEPTRRVPLTPEQAARQRAKQGLELSRQRVLQQLELSRDPRHRRMLDDALAAIETKLHDSEL